MTDQRNPVCSSHRKRTRPLFSARKVALMASVATGLAVYGFSSPSNRFDIFSSAAHAQVSNAVSKAAQPRRFRRIWWSGSSFSSVISVKVTMKDKRHRTRTTRTMTTKRARLWSVSFGQFGGGPNGGPHKIPGVTATARRNDGSGFRVLYFIRWLRSHQQPRR